MEAAVDAVIAVGYDALTLEAVAARAGVGKAALYRRFSGKLDLVLAALDAEFARLGPPEPAIGDALLAIAQTTAAFYRSRAGAFILALVPALQREPDLRGHLAAKILSRRRKALEDALSASGISDPDEAGAVIDLLVGAVIYRTFVYGRVPGSSRADLYARIVAHGVQRNRKQ